MNSATRTSNSSQAHHCSFRTASGRFCRLPIADPAAGLCFRHGLQRKNQTDAANLAAALTGDCQEFQTAVGIHASLSTLYKLLADDRISARRAAVLAYISNLLLRTIPMALAELRGESPDSDQPIRVDVELPRPSDGPELPAPHTTEHPS